MDSQETHQPNEIALGEKHIRSCQLVLNRRAMLQRIGYQQVVAELGVNKGSFSAEILRITRPAELHLVDAWDSTRYNDSIFKEVSTRFAEQIASGRMKIHRALSVAAAESFDDAFFDFVYIDTDHSYTVTKQELQAYAPKIKPHGIIAGHDYSMGNWRKKYRYGVIEAVHEFCVTCNWEFAFLTLDYAENQSFALRRML